MFNLAPVTMSPASVPRRTINVMNDEYIESCFLFSSASSFSYLPSSFGKSFQFRIKMTSGNTFLMNVRNLICDSESPQSSCTGIEPARRASHNLWVSALFPHGQSVKALQILHQYLYFCTTKASKLSTCLQRRLERSCHFRVSICIFVLVKQVSQAPVYKGALKGVAISASVFVLLCW